MQKMTVEENSLRILKTDQLLKTKEKERVEIISSCQALAAEKQRLEETIAVLDGEAAQLKFD